MDKQTQNYILISALIVGAWWLYNNYQKNTSAATASTQPGNNLDDSNTQNSVPTFSQILAWKQYTPLAPAEQPGYVQKANLLIEYKLGMVPTTC